MSEKPLTFDQATEIYNILVEHAGARDDSRERQAFVHYVIAPAPFGHEWRFQGNPGFGGKFRNNSGNEGIPYVDCYQEHLNVGRREIINECNRVILRLFQKR